MMYNEELCEDIPFLVHVVKKVRHQTSKFLLFSDNNDNASVEM